jgi:hypothetical protein
VVEQRAYPTLRAVTVPKRGVMETIAPEHGFWNSQIPVSGVPGDDLVSVRFLERFWLASSPLSENILLRLARKDQQAASALSLELTGKIVTVLDCVIEDLLEVVSRISIVALMKASNIFFYGLRK